MKNRTQFLLWLLPFLVLLVLALAGPWLKKKREAALVDKFASEPLRTVPVGLSNKAGFQQADFETYSDGSYAIAEIGRLRLAVADWSFNGASSGTILISTPPDASNTGRAGSAGTGRRKRTQHYVPGGTEVEYAGLTFKVTYGKFQFDGNEIDVTGPPTLVIVRDHAVSEVREIRPR